MANAVCAAFYQSQGVALFGDCYPESVVCIDKLIALSQLLEGSANILRKFENS